MFINIACIFFHLLYPIYLFIFHIDFNARFFTFGFWPARFRPFHFSLNPIWTGRRYRALYNHELWNNADSGVSFDGSMGKQNTGHRRERVNDDAQEWGNCIPVQTRNFSFWHKSCGLLIFGSSEKIDWPETIGYVNNYYVTTKPAEWRY